MSGFGMKGQGARRTKKHPRFEGGANPLYKRLPKITMRRMEHMLEYISLEKIFYGAERGWLNLNEEINMRALYKAGLISKPKHGCELRLGVSLSRDLITSQNLEFVIPEGTPALKIKLTTFQPEAINLLKKQNSDCVLTAVTYTNAELAKHLTDSVKIVREEYASKIRLIELEKLYKLGCEVEGGVPDWMMTEMKENGRTGSWRIEELYQGVPGYPISQPEIDEIRAEIAKRQDGLIGNQRIRKRKPVVEREFKFEFLHGKKKL